MALSQTNGQNERLNGNLKFANGSLADLESCFLEQRLRAMHNYMTEHLPETNTGWSPLSWCRSLQLEPARCEAEVLGQLLHHPERQTTHLEELLGDRLCRLDAQLVRLSCTHNYEESYWETETERQVTTKILHDWWHWLKTDEQSPQTQ